MCVCFKLFEIDLCDEPPGLQKPKTNFFPPKKGRKPPFFHHECPNVVSNELHKNYRFITFGLLVHSWLKNELFPRLWEGGLFWFLGSRGLGYIKHPLTCSKSEIAKNIFFIKYKCKWTTSPFVVKKMGVFSLFGGWENFFMFLGSKKYITHLLT